jgi:hypothetical protein
MNIKVDLFLRGNNFAIFYNGTFLHSLGQQQTFSSKQKRRPEGRREE